MLTKAEADELAEIAVKLDVLSRRMVMEAIHSEGAERRLCERAYENLGEAVWRLKSAADSMKEKVERQDARLWKESRVVIDAK